MAAVVHAASAGTTAAGLRAGVPAVPVPMTGDQPFWACRLTGLGVSPAAIRFKHLRADRLGAIRDAVDDPAYARRAADVAALIDGEGGAGRVVELVESLGRDLNRRQRMPRTSAIIGFMVRLNSRFRWFAS
jgi:UDP:flavonoid glycosyltransferase YjiC (YdhE family)